MSKVIEIAESMAMEMYTNAMMYRRWVYRIKDNPYRNHKKNRVIWHNAFYDKCKEIGRRGYE